MFDRLRRSWDLTKQTAALLAKDKVLILFPLMSGIASIVVVASFIVPVFATGGWKSLQHQHQATPATYAFLFAFYFCNYFVTIFFNCALMASANMALAGGRASLRDGFGIAMQRLGRIIMWTLVACTVGLLLRTLEERAGRIGRIVIALLGTAWSIMTYFIVPVIVFEDQDVFDGVRRSAYLVKQTWGENVGRALSFIVIGLLGICVVFGGGFAGMIVHPLVGVLFMVVSFIMLVTIMSAMSGIYTVALYRYACHGVVAEGFSPELIQAAFAEKKKSKFRF
jgi:Family of unknown function (DUF6159)